MLHAIAVQQSCHIHLLTMAGKWRVKVPSYQRIWPWRGNTVRGAICHYCSLVLNERQRWITQFTHTEWWNVSVNMQHYSSWNVSPKLSFDGWGHLLQNDNHRVHWQRCRTRIHIQLLRKKRICFLIPNSISYKYILWIHGHIPSTDSLFKLQLLKESTKHKRKIPKVLYNCKQSTTKEKIRELGSHCFQKGYSDSMQICN